MSSPTAILPRAVPLDAFNTTISVVADDTRNKGIVARGSRDASMPNECLFPDRSVSANRNCRDAGIVWARPSEFHIFWTRPEKKTLSKIRSSDAI